MKNKTIKKCQKKTEADIHNLRNKQSKDISQNHEVKMDYVRRGGNETNTKKEGRGSFC